MDTIGVQDLWSFQDNGTEAVVAKCVDVRRSQGNHVSSYVELAGRIAELQFRNRDYVFLFRGQTRDHKNSKGLSTLQPRIFRRQPGDYNMLAQSQRFEKLRESEAALLDRFRNSGFLGIDELSRHKLIRWSILQHYEVCDTPLLDVTQSLRIAASFASDENDSEDAYLYVFGVPNISGAISASAEAGIQIVRLSSVCPPTAMRPHLQEGYLLGVYPEIDSIDEKRLYGLSEIDFGKRLIAKFRFDPKVFWTKGGQFQAIGKRALYPPASQDPLYAITKQISAANPSR